MYKIFLRPLLFSLDAEKVHHIVFKALKLAAKFPGLKKILTRIFVYEAPSLERNLFGLTFKNPVGLAAGFDKDAGLVDEIGMLGFGFIEIGTLTPKPQEGNEKPRLFRLPRDKALINRMGFNNEGVLAAAERLKKRRSKIIVGGNIGKNKTTPNEIAQEDYTYCVEMLYPYVDYFVINVSSPNTPGLRELQEKGPLLKLVQLVKQLTLTKPEKKPVLLKIAPDLTTSQLDDIVSILKSTSLDGVVATNTTLSREGLQTLKSDLDSIGAGGLSGKPLLERSTETIRYLRSQLGEHFPIIGAGGIMSPADAMKKIRAGADLIQIYTGFIYEGPGFVKAINKTIAESN